MVSASSKDALRRALVGIQIDVQASEYSDVAKEAGTSVRSRSLNNRFLNISRSCGESKAW
jgi:hypothetical protein